MSLLAPGALGLLALAIPLIALYMLRSRRARVEVPSIRLWIAEEDAVAAALPWRRLRVTALLVLQLVVLALFALLLARPFFSETTPLGPHTVLVVDTSGSMAMASRFDAAKARALELVAEASEEHLISIVEAGPRPRVVAAFSRDPAGLRSAVEALEPGGGLQDLAGAMRLARGLSTPDRDSLVLLLTDGGVEGELAEPVNAARHLRFDRVGENVAITGLGTDVPGEGAPRLFLEVASFAAGPRTVTVALTVDGLDVGTISFDVAPGERAREIIPIDAGPGQVVEASLLGEGDANPLDDRAAVVLGGGPGLGVAVLGEGSVFLDALIAATPGVAVAAGAPPDLVVVDGGSAADVDRPAWIIAPSEPPAGVRVVGKVENPIVTFQRPSEPILEGLDLSDLAIADAQIIEVAGWLPLVRAGDVPLILLGEIEGHRVVYFAFDLTHSNLPLLVDFPILGERLLGWLGGGRGPAAVTAPAGTPIPLTAPAGALTTVIDPTGEAHDATGALEFTATSRPGVYRIEHRDAEGTVVRSEAVARSFVSSEAAGPSRTVGTVIAGSGIDGEGTLLREWAPLLLALVLALVAVEWWVAFDRPRPRRRRSVGEATA